MFPHIYFGKFSQYFDNYNEIDIFLSETGMLHQDAGTSSTYSLILRVRNLFLKSILETESQKTTEETEGEGLVSEHWRNKAGYGLQQARKKRNK